MRDRRRRLHPKTRKCYHSHKGEVIDVPTAAADWDSIKAEYIAGITPVREIAQKHGVSEGRIYRKASSEGWKKLREKIQKKTEEKYVARCARTRARELAVISSAAEKMAALLDRTVDELSAMGAEQRVKSLKGLAATASAISANTDTLIKIYGIQTPAQVEAQKIARDRLKLDQRKQDYEEARAQDAQAGADVHVSITVEQPTAEAEAPVEEAAEAVEALTEAGEAGATVEAVEAVEVIADGAETD